MKNKKSPSNNTKYQKSADDLSLIDLGQIDDFQITDSEAGFIKKIHAVRNKRLRYFTADEVRVCLAQNVGTVYLVRKALDVLEVNPWIETEHYEGDLLNTCVGIPDDYWEEWKKERARMQIILQAANEQVGQGKISAGRQEIRELGQAFRKFGLDPDQVAAYGCDQPEK